MCFIVEFEFVRSMILVAESRVECPKPLVCALLRFAALCGQVAVCAQQALAFRWSQSCKCVAPKSVVNSGLQSGVAK